MNIFEKASRRALRFATPIGLLSVEQLWPLPLQHATKPCLDKIAIELNRKLQSQTNESFVKPVDTVTQSTLKLKLDIVVRIIEVRMGEDAAVAERKVRAKKREELILAIEAKRAEKLQTTDLAELEKQLAELG